MIDIVRIINNAINTDDLLRKVAYGRTSREALSRAMISRTNYLSLPN
jgi:hypothetical protein